MSELLPPDSPASSPPPTRSEQTLILIKPDAVARGLSGEIISRFERKGLRLAAMRLSQLDQETAKLHYAEHQGKSFFEGLVSFITSGPLIAIVLEGNEAVATSRRLIGSAHEPAPGTIRGDYAPDKQHNLVHGSDSLEAAAREIKLYFGEL